MAALCGVRALPALLVLLGCALGCGGSPLLELGDGADIPTVPTPTESTVIDVQEQIYILTGVFVTFIVFLLVVSLVTAYVVVGMNQTIKTLQAAGAGLTAQSQKRATRRNPVASAAPPQQRDNRAFAPDDDEDERWGGDELQNRGFDQYPDQGRSEPPRAGRQLSSPTHISEPHGFDRFHQPLPDAHMPSDRARRDSNSRYGAGNLARLPKGPAPQPGGYDGRYPDGRDRRSRSPGRGQW
ncbi:uncharacterized protein LOC122380863 isoform X1 [Amphibalanus amphitrite]|uniref:uncharacterized protein LOC122380863 isoform X1 n=1 Tax=Amphibalanus amphitrite TaxID=1232801 RepID=UPI001C924FAB|nr:uncharacterized protein LOC122380863 isoform X1 [Amphibalanus amphitrite]